MKQLIKEKIMAMVPEYTKEGANYTLVKRLNGEDKLLKKNINSSLKSLCEYYHIDLKSSNKTCKTLLGIKKTPPIFIKDDLVLIGVKTRIPIGKDDGAYSYINIEMIRDIKENLIYFKNGHSLNIKSSVKTLEKHIKQAKLLKEIIKNRNIVMEDGDIYLGKEDLKRDLDLIYSKLLKIEKTLFK